MIQIDLNSSQKPSRGVEGLIATSLLKKLLVIIHPAIVLVEQQLRKWGPTPTNSGGQVGMVSHWELHHIETQVTHIDLDPCEAFQVPPMQLHSVGRGPAMPVVPGTGMKKNNRYRWHLLAICHVTRHTGRSSPR